MMVAKIVVNGSGCKPEPAQKVGIRICDGVVHIKENGAVRKYWLGELDEAELRGFLAVFLAEIHALVEHRGRIYGYVRAVNGELDRRVNEKACESTPGAPARGGHI